MAEQGADRRSRRTRRLIAEALGALLRERRYDRITVQQILDRADIGRSTFYTHFREKDAVLLGEFARLLDALYQDTGPGGAGDRELLPSLELFRQVQEQHALFQSLVRGGSAEMLFVAGHRALRTRVAQRLAAIVRDDGASPVPPPILADYVVGTFLSLLRWWLEHQMPYPPERMHAIFRQLVAPAIQAAVQPGGADRDGEPSTPSN